MAKGSYWGDTSLGQPCDIEVDGTACIAWNPEYAFNDRANGYWCPLGAEPGEAWVYMLVGDVNELPTDEPVVLSMTAGKAISIPNLWFDTAICASGGATNDIERCYAVRLVDVRFMFSKLTACTVAFNVRLPAPPTLSTDGSDLNEFYADTLEPLGGAPYSWDQAAAAIWEELPTDLAGIYPGLPFAPDGIPQNTRYEGVNAWHALHDLLAKINCTTAYDPRGAEFRIVRVGDFQPGLSAALGTYKLVIDEGDPVSNAATRLPETVRVCFHEQSAHFGTEPDTPREGNWIKEGAHQEIDVPAGGVISETVKVLWDDLPAIVDFQGNVTNQDALDARAAERAQRWIFEQKGLLRRGFITLQGIAPEFAPGEQTTSVWWRDVGDGLLTEVARIPEPPKPPWSRGAGKRRVEPSENFQPPDFARHTTPIYPRVAQVVKVVNPVKDDMGRMFGEVVALDPQGNFIIDADDKERETCLVADLESGADGQIDQPRTRRVDQLVIARLNGTAPFNDGALPLYVCDREPPAKHGVLLADLQPGLSAPVLTADGDTIVGNDVWSATTQPAGTKVAIRWEAIQSSWWILTPTSSTCILGKTETDIKWGKSGLINVYSVPTGGLFCSDEAASGATITACNKFFGYIPEGTWVLCEKSGSGYYISTSNVGNRFLGKVGTLSPGSSLNAYYPFQGAVTTYLLSDGAANAPLTGKPTVQAFVECPPVIDGEQVMLIWTGSAFSITSTLNGGAYLGKTQSKIAKGGSALDCLIALSVGGAPTTALNTPVQSPLGDLDAGKLIWISRTGLYGFAATSAEC